MLLVADRDVRVINDDGQLLAHFTIDPHQAIPNPNKARPTYLNCPACHATSVRDVSRHNKRVGGGTQYKIPRSLQGSDLEVCIARRLWDLGFAA